MAKSKKAHSQTAERKETVPTSSLNANQLPVLNDSSERPTPDFRFSGGPVRVLSEMPRSFSILQNRYQENLYMMLIYVYEIACYLRSNEMAWADFQNDPVWSSAKNRPQKEHRHTALQPVLRLAFGLGDKSSSKLASKYYAALAEPFRQDVAADALAQFIESNGGVEQLARAEALRRRPTANPVAELLPPSRDLRVVEVTTGPQLRVAVEVLFADHAVRVTIERVPLDHPRK